jgi:3-hydroxyacyl-CoA dehydrogenase
MALRLERVVVLGAGVMGAQLAALLANSGRQVHLLDLSEKGDGTARARRGMERARQGRAFFSAAAVARVIPGSLEKLEGLSQADWAIEAIVEDQQLKRALLARLEKAAPAELVVSSNTSGLSIAGLAEGRSKGFRRRFLGTHFFNPPRAMKLVELVRGPDTEPGLAAEMGRFLEEELGKRVVLARDTPNFIANRLGVFALMAALWQMERQGLRVEEVDACTGPLLGRPRSATLRLCDLIGLDTLAQVARTAYEQLAHEAERQVFALPGLVERMLEKGLLGAKSGAGFYRKSDAGFQVLDLETFQYRDAQKAALGELEGVLGAGDLNSRLRAVWEGKDRWAGVAREHLVQVLAYGAEHGQEMADNVAQIDRAMRWGFNWEAGPFQIWDLLGATEVASALYHQGRPVPRLVEQVARGPFYKEGAGERQALSPLSGRHERLEPEPEERQSRWLDPARARWANEGAYLVEVEDSLGALVWRGKLNVLGEAGLELVQRAVEEAPFAGLVLCGLGEHFSAGADLRHLSRLAEAGDWRALEDFVRRFQEAVMALRYAPFPVVAAPRGLALGGGCEFCLGAAGRVAAAELRMGLVETGVGLIPAGGGCKELARRHPGEVERSFQTIFQGRFSDNAHQAREWGLLEEGDQILMDEGKLLERALILVRSLLERGYTPPGRAQIQVTGDEGRARLEEWLQAQRRAAKISAHDQCIGQELARVLCGGEGPARPVSEERLLELEREAFVRLCATPATRQRMAHLLKTGKPLRN